MPPTREEEQLLWTLLGIFGSLGVAIGVAQSDTFSRRLLDAETLYKKRHSSYKYLWQKMIVDKEQHLLETETNDVPLTLLTTKEEVQEFAKDYLLKPDIGAAQILYIGLDSKDPRAVREYMIWIVVGSVGVYQCEVKLLGSVLSEHFESQVDTTTLCFVADASSGIGLDMVEKVITEHKASSSALVRRPMWMMQLAMIVSEGVLSKLTLTQILSSLCQLEAHWRKASGLSLNGKGKGSNAVGTSDVFRKTVVFTIPGQSVVPALLPLLHSAFPCERHVFLYDCCCASVQRAASSFQKTTTNYEIQTSTVLSPPTLKSSIRTLPKALKELSLTNARTTECWMASVNTFFSLKQHHAVKGGSSSSSFEEYLPFVCRWDYLVEATICADDPKKSLAILNLWQFMTGSRTRQLPNDFIEIARTVVVNLAARTTSPPSESSRRAIENCVFQDKSILIGNKTLIDTVQPQAEWSLKAATKKSGCSCCAPEEEDEEEDEMGATTTDNTRTETVSFLPNKTSTTTLRQRNTFVDGKKTFAFDPNKFP